MVNSINRILVLVEVLFTLLYYLCVRVCMCLCYDFFFDGIQKIIFYVTDISSMQASATSTSSGGNASTTAPSSTNEPQLPGTSPMQQLLFFQRFDYFCVLDLRLRAIR